MPFRRLPLFLATLLASLLATVLPAAAAPTSCPGHYYRGVAPEIVNPKMQAETRELCYRSFGVVHSGITRTPLWSAERLTRERLAAAEALVRSDRFHAERRLPAEGRAELEDYARSGFDRGHMAPSGDMPDRRSQRESFSLANIVPQDPESNRGIWQRIEAAVRELARERGELYVVTGPLFRGGRLKQIGGRVLVPTHLYKVVLDPKSERAAAYLVENAPTNAYSTASLAELEAVAGIEFFPWMPASARKEKLALPKPSGTGRRGGKRSPRGSGAEALLEELGKLLR